jgi:heme exporter protein A
MARLDGRNIRLVRGERTVVEDLSLSVGPGEALLLLGPNGSGKTSLLRAIAGLLDLSAGRIDNPFRTAFQGPEVALKPDATLSSELRFWAGLDGQGADSVTAAAEAMGLEALLDLPVRYLSAGQRVRAGLARVLASGADLWLLDEPTAMLDAASAARLETAARMHLSAGGLIVAATHQPLGFGTAELRLSRLR